MSLDTLELLAQPSLATAPLALAGLDPLSTAPHALQHKIAVRISALLKSKSAERAFATLLAAKALAHEDIVKSHAATWCPILLHMLDLPNPETWTGAIKALCVLFTVSDLRDLGGVSKIADFVKRLVALVPKLPEPSLQAICHLCNIYPNPLRNYIPQISAAATQTIWSGAYKHSAKTLAFIIFAEKTQTATWREQTIALISDIKYLCQEKPLKVLTGSPHPALEPSRLWATLLAYFDISPSGAKVPVTRLVETVDIALRSNNAAIAGGAVQFILDTQTTLASVWAQNFDTIVHSVIETNNFGPQELKNSIKCVTCLLGLIKTVPSRYLRALHSLFNKGYNIVYPNVNSQTSSQSISAMISYEFPDGTQELAVVLSKYSEVLILSMEDIPASFRTKLDANLLSAGGLGDKSALRIATIYPGKLSMLPISLEYGMQGYEALVHPRFPPLVEAAKSSSTEKVSEYDLLESQATSQLPVVEPVRVLSSKEEAVPVQLPEVELESIPQPPPTQYKTQPEQASNASEPQVDTSALKRDVSASEPEPKRAKVESDNGEDDDDFVIPTIEMDSD